MCKTNQVKIKIDGFSLKLMQDLTKSNILECYYSIRGPNDTMQAKVSWFMEL